MGYRIQFDSKVFGGTQMIVSVVLVYKDDVAVPVLVKKFIDNLSHITPNQYHALLIGYKHVLDIIKNNSLKDVIIEHHNEVLLRWAKTLECPSNYQFLISEMLDKYLAIEEYNVFLKKIDVNLNMAKKHLSKIKQLDVSPDIELYSISDILNKFNK